MKKTWQQKMETPTGPEVFVTERAKLGFPAGAKMLISTPKEVRDEIRRVPHGTAITKAELGKRLAARHKADVTCPLTTGIFFRIVAEAALDEFEAGTPVEQVAPFWRVVGPKDPAAKKIRCGPEWIAERRRVEGIS